MLDFTYYDLVAQYGQDQCKHMGNKVMAFDGYGTIYGYTIKNYSGYTPNALTGRIYTNISNTNGVDWDRAYDFLFGAPTTAPNFKKVLA